jgi:hypothetical protein
MRKFIRTVFGTDFSFFGMMGERKEMGRIEYEGEEADSAG